MTYKKRGLRYTDNECYLIAKIIINKIDILLWTKDSIIVDQSENLLTDIRNEYGEIILRIFNHIEEERILSKLKELKE